VKHLNPRQGITTLLRGTEPIHAPSAPCETPKSPPGDYNTTSAVLCTPPPYDSVKHLNPRQGITTLSTRRRRASRRRCWCETPKSPPGDYNFTDLLANKRERLVLCVKHLNPRQGITTLYCVVKAKTAAQKV